jgi:tRNA A37 threonylcarbamoyltransferase TsaD
LPSSRSGPGLPRLLAHALHSQADMHQAYGGVVPELASRDHVRRVIPLCARCWLKRGREVKAIDVVAYTRGPGLAGALLVGAGVAVALGARWSGRRWASTTSKATCCRPSWPTGRRSSPSWRCWCPAGTRS